MYVNIKNFFTQKETQLLADYISQKKALDCLREQEIHRKKLQLLEIQISEAQYKEKIAQYLYENRK